MDFERWRDYFEHNAITTNAEFTPVLEEPLTTLEKKCIGKSIAAFQLGEYSEGRSLMGAARGFAERTENDCLVRITRLFIAEEQNHAMILGRFMTSQGIPLTKRNWTDDVFRALRKPVGFELSVTVLITAEIIALVYYQALKASTGSALLKRICTKILADESMHVAYESQLLNEIRSKHTSIHRITLRLLHTILFIGTTLVVYYDHRPVLNRGGYDLYTFVEAAWAEYSPRLFELKRVEASVGA
jgi:hypothetical protein